MNALHNKLKGKSFNPRVRILKGFTRSAKIISSQICQHIEQILRIFTKKNFCRLQVTRL